MTYIWSISLRKITQLQESEMRPTGWALSYFKSIDGQWWNVQVFKWCCTWTNQCAFYAVLQKRWKYLHRTVYAHSFIKTVHSIQLQNCNDIALLNSTCSSGQRQLKSCMDRFKIFFHLYKTKPHSFQTPDSQISAIFTLHGCVLCTVRWVNLYCTCTTIQCKVGSPSTAQLLVSLQENFLTSVSS